MKKIFFVFLLSAICAGAFAQDMYDALNLTSTNYYGTARSMALGNAMTAVGGDLGSIEINPAGSAVLNYSVFSFSPAMSFASTSAGYQSVYRKSYIDNTKGSQSRFDMPSVGFVTTIRTGQRTGVKKYSIGFTLNTTNIWNDRFVAGGENSSTSFVGSLANSAASASFYDLWNADLRNSNVNWNSALAARTYLIWPLSDDSGYIGATETLPDYKIPGTLYQKYGRQTYGSRRDMMLNFGLDISDQLYFGVNLGLPIGNYHYNMGFSEYADDPGAFELEYYSGEKIYFNGADYAYRYSASMSGIYGKFGVIWLPVAGLRIGAALKTPTCYNITENYSVGMASTFDNDIYPLGKYSQNYLNPESQKTYGTYSYSLIDPLVFNVGIAYTFFNVAMLSFDFETKNNSRMGYGSYRSFTRYDDAVNSSIRNFAGRTNEYRVGLEIKPTPMFSIRLGYTNRSSSEYWYTNNVGDSVYASDYVKNYSLYNRGTLTLDLKSKVSNSDLGERAPLNTVAIGFGYSSRGSFYLDLAYRLSCYSCVYYMPYSDYKKGTPSPSVSASRNLSDVVLTLGWRF